MTHVLRTAAWITATACAVWILSGLVRLDAPMWFLATLSAYAGIAMWRPFDALLLLAGLGPLIGVTTALTGLPLRSTHTLEAFVLLLLAGAIVRARPKARAGDLPRPFTCALLLLGGVAALSAYAQFPLMALRLGHRDSLIEVWRILTWSYFEHSLGFGAFAQAMLLIEGLGLCGVVAYSVRTASDASRLAGLLVAGAAGAAAINVYRLVEVTLRNGPFFERLWPSLLTLRINTQFGDLNAAGSYFAMMTVIAVGFAGFSSKRALIFGCAVLPLVGATWLSGSRAAVLATAVCSAWLLVSRLAPLAPRQISRTVVLRATVVLVAIAGMIAVYPAVRNVPVGYSVFARVELAKTGMRMLRETPLTGVGIARFYELFPTYSSAHLRRKFLEAALVPVTRENAHNNFVQILAELGIVGFVPLVGVLAMARKSGQGGWTDPTLRRSLLAGAAAFLATCLAGHPLLSPEVAYPFWLLLGLVVGGGRAVIGSPSPWVAGIVAAVLVTLVATLPIQTRGFLRNADLDGVSTGLSQWQRDEGGMRYRWAGRESSFFVETGAPVLLLPLQAVGDTARVVQLRIDGRVANEWLIPTGAWKTVRVVLVPRSGEWRFREIQLVVNTPAAVAATPSDRVLMVGRPEWLGRPTSGGATTH
ncbi:MAG TPA: O-antigen ligase family protein [Gemmatimonadaceae bacterium]|nr:O-antigen ligase family protein [Gemmatimonadaceae bacterium]